MLTAAVERQVLELLREMRRGGTRPNKHVYSALITAMRKDGKVLTILQLMKDVQREEIESDAAVFNAALRAVPLAEDPKAMVDNILGIMERMEVQPDTYTFNLAFRAYKSAGDLDSALKLMHRMEEVMSGGV